MWGGGIVGGRFGRRPGDSSGDPRQPLAPYRLGRGWQVPLPAHLLCTPRDLSPKSRQVDGDALHPER